MLRGVFVGVGTLKGVNVMLAEVDGGAVPCNTGLGAEWNSCFTGAAVRRTPLGTLRAVFEKKMVKKTFL